MKGIEGLQGFIYEGFLWGEVLTFQVKHHANQCHKQKNKAIIGAKDNKENQESNSKRPKTFTELVSDSSESEKHKTLLSYAKHGEKLETNRY